MTTQNYRHIATLLAISCVFGAGATDVSLEVFPGSLKSALASADTVGMTTLTLTGQIDVRDLKTAAALPLERLDLSATAIRSVSSVSELFLGRHSFEADILPDYIFFQSPVKSCVLPTSVKSIGVAAFADSSIESVVIPDGVTTIGDFAFRGCRSLTGIEIPASVTGLGAEVFSACSSLKNVSFADGSALVEIPSETFAGCTALTLIKLPDSIKTIGSLIFRDSGIRSLEFTGTVDAAPFAIAEVHELEYPNIAINTSCTSPGLYFNDAMLKSPFTEFTAIPAAAFAGATMTDADVIMKGVTTVGEYAFYDIPAKIVTLPKGVAALGKGVLGNASQLEKIMVTDLEDNIPAVDEHTFDGLDRNKVKVVTLHAFVDKWKAAPYWNEFEILDEFNSVDEIADTSFSLRYADGTLYLTSSNDIESVSVSDESGKLVASAHPGSSVAEITVAVGGARILIVTSRTGGRNRCDKIIIPAS